MLRCEYARNLSRGNANCPRSDVQVSRFVACFVAASGRARDLALHARVHTADLMRL